MLIEEIPNHDDLVVQILGKPRKFNKRTILYDGQARWINGQYIVGNVPVLDENGDTVLLPDRNWIVTRRQRFRIPKGHPWRGKRPPKES